jgi:hypothetical protein
MTTEVKGAGEKRRASHQLSCTQHASGTLIA